MGDRMSKADQAALRGVIKARLKVLRRDVAARQAELYEELTDKINAGSDGRDKEWADALFLVQEAVKEANRKANDAIRALPWPEVAARWDGKEYDIVTAREIGRPDRPARQRAKEAGRTQIAATVAAALAEIDRVEADLLTDLTVLTIETDAGRDFLNKIPTVGQLVPAARLLAIAGATTAPPDDARTR